jgi:Fur family peroxide stress response transcriptional regulator
MSRVESTQSNDQLSQRLRSSGFRFTPQRRRVYDVLTLERDHPTAEEVFFRARRHMPDISMATVYNCLDALVRCRLIRQVRLERGATRYCPNMEDHCHYYCDACESVFDVPLPADTPSVPRPRGFRVDHFEIAVHGICSGCQGKSSGDRRSHGPSHSRGRLKHSLNT